jgi:hypothetical protein
MSESLLSQKNEIIAILTFITLLIEVDFGQFF